MPKKCPMCGVTNGSTATHCSCGATFPPESFPSSEAEAPKPAWHYMNQGRTCGPISLDELKARVASGELKPTDEVWRRGSADWLRIEIVPELQESSGEKIGGAGQRKEPLSAASKVDESLNTPEPEYQYRAPRGMIDVLEEDLRQAAEAVKSFLPGQGPQGSRPVRQPVRSKVLGWTLKLLGIAWIGLIFQSHLVDQLIAQLKNNVPAIQILLLVLYLPGFAFIYGGYRLCLRVFRPYEHPDRRRPIVYLRAFGDDGVGNFQPDNFLARMHGIETFTEKRGRSIWTTRWRLPFWLIHPIKIIRLLFNIDRSSAEEVLAAAFRRCGPFVAIGQPGERMATPGADRMYVSDRDWQNVVIDYLSRCQAVVIQPSTSAGIQWEMDEVFDRVPRHRIIISMSNLQADAAKYNAFRNWLEAKYALVLPSSLPRVATTCFVYFESDGTARIQQLCYTSPLLWSFTCNAVDADGTFHAFIQGLKGDPRELPRQPKGHFFHGVVSLVVPLAMLAGIYVPIVLQGIEKHQADRANRPQLVEYDNAPDAGPMTVYRGDRLGYEIQLGKNWVARPLPLHLVACERLLSYHGGVAEVSCDVFDRTYDDIDQFAAELKKGVEADLRARHQDSASVQIVKKDKVKADGVDWWDVQMKIRNEPDQETLQRAWVYQARGRCLVLSLGMPVGAPYDRFADQFFATVRITEREKKKVIPPGATR